MLDINSSFQEAHAFLVYIFRRYKKFIRTDSGCAGFLLQERKAIYFKYLLIFFVLENKNCLLTLFKLFRSIILSIKYGLWINACWHIQWLCKKCLSVYFLNNCLATFSFFALHPFLLLKKCFTKGIYSSNSNGKPHEDSEIQRMFGHVQAIVYLTCTQICFTIESMYLWIFFFFGKV